MRLSETFIATLDKLAGHRLNEVLQGLKDVVTTMPKKEHLQGYLRHSALNAGMAEKMLRKKWLAGAAHSAAFALMPPTHHTVEDMKGLIDKGGSRFWYQVGAGRRPDPYAEENKHLT